jgi:ribosomal protein S18 acetylase RimI-like enzyme
MIRAATLDDLDALAELESASFRDDLLSRRQFRYLLSRGHALTLVETQRGRLRGYVLLVFRANSTVARIYTIAVATRDRRRGVGAALLAAAGKAARRRGCDRVRAEVRSDNRASLALFEHHGYRRFGCYRGYYADGCDAARVERRIRPPRGIFKNGKLQNAQSDQKTPDLLAG